MEEENKMETEVPKEETEEDTMITVNVKTPKEKKAIKINDKASIKEFKAKISIEFNNTPVEHLCLIYAGKMLKDHENLDLHSIKDNVTVHLVIKTTGPLNNATSASNAAERQAAMSRQATANISQTPFGLGGVGGLPGLANLGMGSANFMELQHQMQETMKNNPSMLKDVIDSPLTQNLMANPEIMKSLIMSNPQLTRLMDRNPELYDLMGNQEVLRQTMEISKNPELLHELMGTSPDPKSSDTTSTPQSKAQTPNTLTGSTLYNSAGMHSLMQQMADNPNIMQNMMNAPYTQAMLDNMVQNPDLAANLVGSSPLFANNTQIQEQMKNMMPAFMQQLQNPAVHNLMSNPDALRSLVQIQGGLQSLQNVSPDLYSSLGMPSINANAAKSTEATDQNSSEESKKEMPLDTNTVDKSSEGIAAKENNTDEKIDPFNKLMNSMVNKMVQEGYNAPPDVRYREQLETLESFGFVDKDKSIKLLTANNGDVNTTIDKLLSSSSTRNE